MSLSADLRARARNLAREQEARAAEARRKQERERALQARLRQGREAHEEGLRQQRLAEQQAQEEERLRHEGDIATNQGVWWRAELALAPADEAAVAARGIRRAADRVLHQPLGKAVSLPASAGASLAQQDAPRNGPPLFELRAPGGAPGGARVHAGVLDYTAPEGTVLVPEHIARNLGGGEGAGPVTVTYRRLPKGTYARFQPRASGFHEALGDALKPALEAALERHSTLTEGEWLGVPFGGAVHELLVQKLAPASAVSVIDTELEAEVEPSLEAEQRLREEAAAAAARDAELTRLAQQVLKQRAAEEAAARQEEAAQGAARQAQAADWERQRQERLAALPPEPAEGTPDTLLCSVQTPGGERVSRRLPLGEPLASLFTFVEAKVAAELARQGVQLATRFPRRLFLRAGAGAKSLAELGFRPGQELFFVERLA